MIPSFIHIQLLKEADDENRELDHTNTKLTSTK